MKIISIFYIIGAFFFYAPLFSQNNGVSNTETNKSKYNVNISTQMATIQGANVSKSTASLNNASSQKTGQDEEEYTEVMVDKIEYSNYGKAQSEEPDKNTNLQTNPIPYSYGDLKGIFMEAGKNVLVFESESGVLSFVTINMEKNNKVSWKLLYQINRI